MRGLESSPDGVRRPPAPPPGASEAPPPAPEGGISWCLSATTTVALGRSSYKGCRQPAPAAATRAAGRGEISAPTGSRSRCRQRLAQATTRLGHSSASANVHVATPPAGRARSEAGALCVVRGQTRLPPESFPNEAGVTHIDRERPLAPSLIPSEMDPLRSFVPGLKDYQGSARMVDSEQQKQSGAAAVLETDRARQRRLLCLLI
ncbi:uncharacterized protein LOC135186932 [Pogoniulus pusillus]|uniref:uncharacterized protein LOC135186932 n=1 Tax=Pogoniulus pusillus TaxID=488313 RepID=UPI0030B9376B